MQERDVTDYEIMLEWERGEPLDQPANAPCENFGNVEVKFTDGRRYALNVWTFDFLPLARYPWPYEPVANLEPASFVRPPDLFVDKLERRSIEATVRRLVEEGGLDDKWLVGEPFSAWWLRLRNTGEIGPIRLGFTRFELRELWGEPDDESVRKAGENPAS